MRKRLSLFLATLIGLPLLALAAPALPAAAYNPTDGACSQPGAGSSSVCANNDTPMTGPDGIIVRITRLVALIAGIIAVIVIIVYGIMMVFSYGDSGKTRTARNAIIGAVVGLVVIGLSQTIVVFIVSRL